MPEHVQEDEAVRRRYLDLLGASDIPTLERSIVDQILRSIPRRSPIDVPVRVSRGASQLLVDTNPRFSVSVPEGRIAFDETLKQFVVTLNSRYENVRLQDAAAGMSTETVVSSLLLRGRFTYAHEIAHRFCFVSTEEGWVRAIDVATREMDDPASCIRAVRRLVALEEWLCNSVAGKVLIPDEVLSEDVGTLFPSDSFPGDESFYGNVCSLANKLLVSRECLLYRIQRAIQLRTIEASDSFCMLLVSHTDRTPRGRSFWRSRVRRAIVPRVISGVSISALAGVETHTLGPEACRMIGNLLEAGWRQPHGRLETPVMLPSAARSRAPRPVVAKLLGWWQDFGPGQREGFRDLLLWGQLN